MHRRTGSPAVVPGRATLPRGGVPTAARVVRFLTVATAVAYGVGEFEESRGAATRPAPSFEKLRAVGPPDGAVVPSRPVFQVAFDGVRPREARRMRFLLELVPADPDEAAYVYDQRRRRSGWLVTSDGTAVFRPPRRVADGEYSWRFAAWNGVDWVPAAEHRALRVDTVPPAPVEGIRLSHDLDAGTVALAWKPVVLDENGAAEFVTGYHIYRYAEDPDLPHVRAFEVGFVEVPSFTDRPPEGADAILYYRIAAEDEAGNISVRVEPTEPEPDKPDDQPLPRGR